MNRKIKPAYVNYDIFTYTKELSIYDQIEYRKEKRPREFNSLGINLLMNTLR